MTAAMLEAIRDRTVHFLRARQTIGRPFGHFNLCQHAYAEDDLAALCVALELYRMLGADLAAADIDYAVQRLIAAQLPVTGLTSDPSWRERLPVEEHERLQLGDSFFTRTAICAVAAWNRRLNHPIDYLTDVSASALPRQINWRRGGHDRFSIGDIAVLVRHNTQLDVPGAAEQALALRQEAEAIQDPETGLWLADFGENGLTPSINLTFHLTKFLFNAENHPLPFAERIVDSCLQSCRDERHYSWETGYACNDLDLALVFYAALQYTDHRLEEVAEWARERLPLILKVQKPDGGFSFYHDHAMENHFVYRISPSESEGDLWGTLMYVGTICMMVRLGFPELRVPWTTSELHRVPSVRTSFR